MNYLLNYNVCIAMEFLKENIVTLKKMTDVLDALVIHKYHFFIYIYLKWEKDILIMLNQKKDIGFKGDTGRISHYDLYIPNHNKFGNFIIEFQSRFHDTKSDFDRRKKEFAISKGYTFMSFDERRVDENDISVMLFGKVIDDDIRKLSYKKYAPDLTCCQELINQHYTIKKISEELNIPISFLYKRYCDGAFNIPKDRKEKIFNKKSIVRIDNNNNIKYFDSPYQVFLQYGYNISKLKYGIMIYSQGYFWVIKSDYISGNYVAHKKYKYVNLAN